MKRNLRLKFIKGDVLAVLLVLAAAAAVMVAYIPDKDPAHTPVVQIRRDGMPVREVPLDRPAHIEVSGEYRNVVVVEDGRVCIAESDCPGADCVHSGWISEPGRSIVCLPNRVEVRIGGASEVDFAVG